MSARLLEAGRLPTTPTRLFDRQGPGELTTCVKDRLVLDRRRAEKPSSREFMAPMPCLRKYLQWLYSIGIRLGEARASVSINVGVG